MALNLVQNEYTPLVLHIDFKYPGLQRLKDLCEHLEIGLNVFQSLVLLSKSTDIVLVLQQSIVCLNTYILYSCIHNLQQVLSESINLKIYLVPDL